VLIRGLATRDMAAILRLRDAAGWNQTAKDIGRLLALEPEGCFAACIDGRVVGTTTTTTYGTELAWVGMVLVDPEYRRRGIATALMQHALDYLNRRGVVTIKLDASAAGRPVYERLGFESESMLERWGGVLPLRGAAPTERGRWEDIAAFDRAAFGADRGPLLRMMIADTGPPCIVKIGDHKLAGYALARPGARAGYIGPVVANDATGAESLTSAAATVLRNEPVVIDIDPSFPGASDLVFRFGFARQREFVRMRLGPAIPLGSPRVFAIAGPAVG
jgi:GNAT superfamily N-acetyltransferase